LLKIEKINENVYRVFLYSVNVTIQKPFDVWFSMHFMLAHCDEVARHWEARPVTKEESPKKLSFSPKINK